MEEPAECSRLDNEIDCDDVDELHEDSLPIGSLCPKKCNLCSAYSCYDSFTFCSIFTKDLKCSMFGSICKKSCGLC